ncbi:MAG: tetratricopeptide repeat protein, partial [Nitrososphaeraceae archaeon]
MEDAEFYYENGLRLYNLGRYSEAVGSFDQAHEKLIENNQASDELLACTLNAKGAALNSIADTPSREQMEKKYTQAIKLFTEAIKIFENIVQKMPVDKPYLHGELALVHHNKGYALGHLGKYQKALVCFEKARKSFDNYHGEKYSTEKADLWRNIGWCRAMKNLRDSKLDYEHGFKEVVEAFTRANREDKSYAIAYNTAGYVYELYKKSDKAIEQYKKAIDIDPRLALPWYNMGYTIWSRVQRKQRNNSNNKNLGKDQYEEQYQKAITYIDYSIKLDPNNPWAWYYKGYVLYEGLGKHDWALSSFNKALEIDPNFLYALYCIGLICHDKQEYDEAIRYFDKSLDCTEQIE